MSASAESLIITDFVVPDEVGLVVAGAATASNGTPLAIVGAVPVIAGSARLTAARFCAASVPSAVGWSAAIAAPGFVWGDDIADAVDRVGLAVSVIVVVAIVVVVVITRRRRTQPQPD